MTQITTNPSVANGDPCIRDTKFTVKQLLKLLIHNSDADILAAYPFLTLQDITYVRSLNGKIPQPVAEVMYSVEDMRVAYFTPPSVSFEEWISSYNIGHVILPEPPKEEAPYQPPPPPDDPNEQNLP